jgi:uncharacterized protein (DUF58 family)
MRWWMAAVSLLVVALVFRLGLLAYAMYALLGVLAVSRYLAHTWSRNLVAQRECNRLEASVGDTVAIALRLHNCGGIPVAWAVVEDLLPPHALAFRPPNLEVRGQRMQIVALGSRKSKTLLYQVRCNQRGYYQLGPTLIETGDVFGLHRRYRIEGEPHFLLVYPRIVPLPGYNIASRKPLGEIVLAHRLYEDPTRIAGVRAYQRGDPLARVHWRATARTGQLHSKVYEPSAVAGATIVLDLHRAAHDPRHEPLRSELAITAAASLAYAVFQTGEQVGLVTNGRDAADRIRTEGWVRDYRRREQARTAATMRQANERLQPLVVPTQRGADQFARIHATLARVELTDGLSLAQLVHETGGRLPRNAAVVAIVPLPAPESVVALLGLKRRGYRVTVVVNTYDATELADAAAALVAAGIRVLHLRDEGALSGLCQQVAWGA